MITIRRLPCAVFVMACSFALPPLSASADSLVPITPPVAPPGSPNAMAEFDLNGDDLVDYKVIYDKKGKVLREEMDFNYDEVLDTFYYYADGILIRQEIDSKNDGSVDIWVYLLDGEYIQRYERDTNGDGKPDVVRTFGGS